MDQRNRIQIKNLCITSKRSHAKKMQAFWFLIRWPSIKISWKMLTQKIALISKECKTLNIYFFFADFVWGSHFRCSHMSSCRLNVTSETFGDPCPGTYKYLEVQFFCMLGQLVPSKYSSKGFFCSLTLPIFHQARQPLCLFYHRTLGHHFLVAL